MLSGPPRSSIFYDPKKLENLGYLRNYFRWEKTKVVSLVMDRYRLVYYIFLVIFFVTFLLPFFSLLHYLSSFPQTPSTLRTWRFEVESSFFCICTFIIHENFIVAEKPTWFVWNEKWTRSAKKMEEKTNVTKKVKGSSWKYGIYEKCGTELHILGLV